MRFWPTRLGHLDGAGSTETRVREKYQGFRDLLTLNNECLELLAGLQEDLQFVPPLRDVLGDRIGAIFGRSESIVSALERLSGIPYLSLHKAVESQRRQVEAYIAAAQELATPRLSFSLSEVTARDALMAGGKAAALGEVKNVMGLPVPEGYVITTEGYRQFFGVPRWQSIRNAMRDLDPSNPRAVQAASATLTANVMEAPLTRAVEVAITERALTLETGSLGLAVRSSAMGEGGTHAFAGQFQSRINVPKDDVVDAYRRVVASRFSERAIVYRLFWGLSERESPMAVLFLPTLDAKAAGVLYTRDPKDHRSENLWITSTRGLALDIASGRTPADLFVVSRGRTHTVVERQIASKDTRIEARDGGGVERRSSEAEERLSASLGTEDLQVLANWGVRIEEHFGTPQDVEWVLDTAGNLWIVQARPLILAEPLSIKARARTREPSILTGGQTVCPGKVSGRAFLVTEDHGLDEAPEGAIVFMPRISPEIVRVLARVGGLVAEWGNITGHGAAILREFKIPSVFGMAGSREHVKTGDEVSLDAVQLALHRGLLWPSRDLSKERKERFRDLSSDPINRRLLALHLLDPSSFHFRPRGCKSAHDVLRFCHEKAIEAMFAVNDMETERGPRASKRLEASVPIQLHVLDLGGGLKLENPDDRKVKPEEIVSRPFQAIWRGICHPGVSWSRGMPASLDGIASVLAGSFASHQSSARRALGDRSYLLVADQYMNLNSRLAYHFTLVDACVTDLPNQNYVAFRFAGGGATRWRRNLRASFIEASLAHFGFQVDRRGDVVNAWFKKAPARETEDMLDILGRLMACASQLDMYMTSDAVMAWYVKQFIEGNYAFREGEAGAGEGPPAPQNP
jgi:pyruvate,water dikinase